MNQMKGSEQMGDVVTTRWVRHFSGIAQLHTGRPPRKIENVLAGLRAQQVQFSTTEICGQQQPMVQVMAFKPDGFPLRKQWSHRLFCLSPLLQLKADSLLVPLNFWGLLVPIYLTTRKISHLGNLSSFHTKQTKKPNLPDIFLTQVT